MSTNTPYCVFNLCALEEHCCGQNVCCRNSYSMGYFGIVCGIFAAILVAWFVYRYLAKRPGFSESAFKRLRPNSTRNYTNNSVFADVPFESPSQFDSNEISSKTSATRN